METISIFLTPLVNHSYLRRISLSLVHSQLQISNRDSQCMEEHRWTSRM